MRSITFLLAASPCMYGLLRANALSNLGQGASIAANLDETTTSSSSTSSNGSNDCYKGGTCDCENLDKDDEKYFQCISNPNCRDCFLSRTLSKSSQTSTSTKISATTTTSPATSTTEPPDNCWIGGPCDCSKFESNTAPWFNCITNPHCEHCWVNGSTLTPPATTIPTTVSANSTSSNEGKKETKLKTRSLG